VNWGDFHPDGERLVSASGAVATVWSVADRAKPLATIKHTGKGKSELKSARFSPDGKWLATASTDGTAQIWDAKTYKFVAKIDRHFPMWCARFSKDSSRLVVGGEDAQAVVYDTATWKPVGIPVLAPGPVFSAAIVEDNQAVVICSLLLDAVQYFEVTTGRALGDGLMIPAQATCVDYMPLDKVVVVSCDDGTVRALGTPFVAEDTPPWMSPFAQRLVGLKKTGPDAFERVDSNLEQLGNYATGAAAASNFDFPRLVRWVLMTGNKRAGLPRFTSTLAANIELRVDERSVDALYECYNAVPGGPLVTAALSLYLKNRRQGEFLADQILRRPDADPLARCYAANTLVQAGRGAEAEATIAKALTDAPEDPRVLRRAAKYYARLFNKQKAIELFDKALKIEPDDAETRRSYAWALYNFGRPAEAAAHFHQAEDLVGSMNDDLIAGICLTAAAQKNDTEAKAAFKRLVALDPDWQKAGHLADLRGWTQNELERLEQVRHSLFPGK
jgi:tetratricopeptide (TPR) repeat protein